MKYRRIYFAFVIAALSMLLCGFCGCAFRVNPQVSNSDKNLENTDMPLPPPPSPHISFVRLDVNGTQVSGSVRGETTALISEEEIVCHDGAEYTVSLDPSGSPQVDSGKVDLVFGENVFYVLEWIEGAVKNTYTVKIYRQPIGGEIEQNNTCMRLSVTYVGYRFAGWYRDNELLSEEEEYTLTEGSGEGVLARFEPISEMAGFDFTSTLNTCVILGAKESVGSVLILPEYVTGIGNGAFSGCRELTEIAFPERLTEIGELAFSDCTGLVELVIPETVRKIGAGALSGCTSLKSLTLPFVGYVNNNYTYPCGYLFGTSKQEGTTVVRQAVYTVDSEGYRYAPTAFDYCVPDSLEEITVCGGVIAINSFNGFNNLKSVILGDNVTKLDSYSFANCKTLSNVVMGKGVTEIGSNAFGGCIGLERITIGENVTTLKNGAFYACEGLTEVIMGTKVRVIGEYAFFHCMGIKSFKYCGTVKQWKNISFGDRWNNWYSAGAEKPDYGYSITYEYKG